MGRGGKERRNQRSPTWSREVGLKSGRKSGTGGGGGKMKPVSSCARQRASWARFDVCAKALTKRKP